MTAATQAVRLVAVVVDGDQVLLVKHRDRGWWELPAGELQIDEDILTGLRRTVGHATGLVVAVDRLSGVYTDGETRLSLVFPDPARGRADPLGAGSNGMPVDAADRRYTVDAAAVARGTGAARPRRQH